jgi:SAM-dependent methyltransferase
MEIRPQARSVTRAWMIGAWAQSDGCARCQDRSMESEEYTRIAAAGDRHWWYRSTRALLEEVVGPHLPAVDARTLYLDAGGGTGATGRWLAERAATVLDDFEPSALQAASLSSAGYRPVRADLNHLPHPDASFDAVLCVTALYHRMNPDPQVVVREFARVVRPGGVVCLMEPGVRRLWRSHDVITHAARRFSRGDLADLIRDAGLELRRSTGAFSFLVPPAVALTVVERLRGRSGPGSSDVERGDGLAGRVLAGLASVERAALRHVDLPAGLSIIAIGRAPH